MQNIVGMFNKRDFCASTLGFVAKAEIDCVYISKGIECPVRSANTCMET